MMPWSGLLPIHFEHAYAMGTSELQLNQHHVGSNRADHEPKHAPGEISDEGGDESNTVKMIRCQNRTPAAYLACEKLLDWHGPVTEVLTIAVGQSRISL